MIDVIEVHKSPTGSGFVRYVDHMGSDRRVVDAARISYLGESKGDEADHRLLDYLFKHRHTSPFEQCNITFALKMPIFVMREFVRHRTFRLNEQSGRYTPFEKDYFTPTIWRKQDTKNKQGSSGVFDQEDPVDASHWFSNDFKDMVDSAYELYQFYIEKGVAREQARMVLPVCMFTSTMVNIDLHNLLHFTTLRTAEKAQLEIQELASAMRTIAEQYYPWTFEAYDKYKFELVERPAASDVRSEPSSVGMDASLRLS